MTHYGLWNAFKYQQVCVDIRPKWMQCFITQTSLRNGGNSSFSFILQDPHYALLNKIRIFDLDVLCNIITMHPVNTQTPGAKF